MQVIRLNNDSLAAYLDRFQGFWTTKAASIIFDKNLHFLGSKIFRLRFTVSLDLKNWA